MLRVACFPVGVRRLANAALTVVPGKPPDARGLANAALCAKASPLLPKGEASAKGEDQIASQGTEDRSYRKTGE